MPGSIDTGQVLTRKIRVFRDIYGLVYGQVHKILLYSVKKRALLLGTGIILLYFFQILTVGSVVRYISIFSSFSMI